MLLYAHLFVIIEPFKRTLQLMLVPIVLTIGAVFTFPLISDEDTPFHDSIYLPNNRPDVAEILYQ